MIRLIFIMSGFFFAFTNLAQSQDVRTISAQEYLEFFNKIEASQETCHTTGYKTFAFKKNGAPFETAQGLLLQKNTSLFSSIYGGISTLRTEQLVIGVDSARKMIYLSSPLENENMNDLREMKWTKFDTAKIDRIVRKTYDFGTTFQVFFKGGAIEYLEFEMTSGKMTSVGVQYSWQAHDQADGRKESYHPYLEMTFSPKKNCARYDYLLDISNYLEQTSRNVYQISDKYAGFQIQDLRYIPTHNN